MKKVTLMICITVLAAGLLSAQSLNLKIGIFKPAIASDLWEINLENLAFKKADMLAAYYAAEYEVFMGRRASFTLEIGDYSRTINSEYRDYTWEDGAPIYQNLSLRITPMEVGLKLYPAGHRGIFNPFAGVGVGLYKWTYEQWGDFINFETMDVYEGHAITDTYSFGFNGRLGFVYRFSRSFGVLIEGRYQYLKGELSGDFEEFEKLDLSGFSAVLGLNIYFR